jgi:TM2 domain-containing membrane protein YozV
VRNNASKPGIGHVIMFAGATVGWLVLFLISLSSHGPGTTFWIKVIFSGLFTAASSVGTLLLLRRVQQQKKQDAAE